MIRTLRISLFVLSCLVFFAYGFGGTEASENTVRIEIEFETASSYFNQKNTEYIRTLAERLIEYAGLTVAPLESEDSYYLLKIRVSGRGQGENYMIRGFLYTGATIFVDIQLLTGNVVLHQRQTSGLELTPPIISGNYGGRSEAGAPFQAAFSDADFESTFIKMLGEVFGYSFLIKTLRISDLQEYAKTAIGKMGATAVSPMIAILSDEDATVRRSAVEILGILKNTRAVDPLIAVLNDANPNIRRAVIVSLGEIATPEAVETLFEAITDKDATVRKAVVDALTKLTKQPFGDDYEAWVLWWKYALVRRGSFTMGNTRNDSEGDDDEKPVRMVTLTYDYWIGRYEVTNAEYRSFLNGRKVQSDGIYDGKTLIEMDDSFEFEYRNGGFVLKSDNGEQNPIMCITWWGAIEYCNWLSEKEGIKKAYDSNGNLLDRNGNKTTDITKVEGYRLPTEAEWEYAARGGQNTRGCKYSGSNTIDNVAWYWGNWGGENGKTHPIGGKAGNELGIYDMSGNVEEWCHDWYDKDYYQNGTRTNPTGPSRGFLRVLRGGSWDPGVQRCRVANRDYTAPAGSGSPLLGFRLSRTIF